jgi:GTPase SAR1 family protein
LIILVYDVTNPKSFENIELWIKIIKEKCQKNIEICLVANKIDDIYNLKIETSQG